MSLLGRYFKIKESGSSVSTEIIAGFTTFLTMSYIIFVNPAILSDAGMAYSGVLAATVLVCAISSILMGLYANLPYGLAPGMGINAFFTYTLVITKGITWQTALGAVFVSGIIFIVLTMLKIRENIVKAIPGNLRCAVAAGIGIFIAFIGLQKAGMIVKSDATLVTLGKMDTGVCLFLAGLLLTAVVVGLLFVPFLFIGNIAMIIPGYATAPALVMVGVYMMSAITKIDFRDFEEGIPALIYG